MADALERLGGEAIFETKLDGARIQIHRDHDEVRLFTRTLDEVTSRLPEVVELALSLITAYLWADPPPESKPRARRLADAAPTAS